MVLVTINVAQPAGICNGSFGIVTEIVYDADVRPPALPTVRPILVDYSSDFRTGRAFLFSVHLFLVVAGTK
jgi:hypothetical protein